MRHVVARHFAAPFLTITRRGHKMRLMRYRPQIAHLLFAILLILNGSAQAWETSLMQVQQATDSVVTINNTSDHCDEQSAATEKAPCQQKHCSVCMNGLATQIQTVLTATPPQILSDVTFQITAPATNELYRPPRTSL